MQEKTVRALISGSPEEFEAAFAVSTSEERRLAQASIAIARKLVEDRLRAVEGRMAHLAEHPGLAR